MRRNRTKFAKSQPLLLQLQRSGTRIQNRSKSKFMQITENTFPWKIPDGDGRPRAFKIQPDFRLLSLSVTFSSCWDLKDGLPLVALDVSGERQLEIVIAIRDDCARRAKRSEDPGVPFASASESKGARQETEGVLNLYRAYLGGRSRLCLV